MKRLLLLLLVLTLVFTGCGNKDDSLDKAKDISADIIKSSEQLKAQFREAQGKFDKVTDSVVKDIKEATKEIQKSEEKTPEHNLLKAKVVRVVDGDTGIFSINGKEERVRLIGVDTPESVGEYKDNPQPFGKEASAFTNKRLKGKTVYLEFDVGEKDKYGRLLCYVWLSPPSDKVNALEVQEKMFNAVLLREGMAQLMTIQPNVRYVDYFKNIQKMAREDNAGLWSK